MKKTNSDLDVKILEILDYCMKSAAINRELADRYKSGAINVQSLIDDLGGSSYFLEQASILEFDIPSIIRSLNQSQSEKLRGLESLSLEDLLLEELGLSVRTYNCLKRLRINTLVSVK